MLYGDIIYRNLVSVWKSTSKDEETDCVQTLSEYDESEIFRATEQRRKIQLYVLYSKLELIGK